MYSIETVSPFCGITPVPSTRIFFVTPMIASVREKLRAVGGFASLEIGRDVR